MLVSSPASWSSLKGRMRMAFGQDKLENIRTAPVTIKGVWHFWLRLINEFCRLLFYYIYTKAIEVCPLWSIDAKTFQGMASPGVLDITITTCLLERIFSVRISTGVYNCIFFPKLEFFYKSLFGGIEFFINNNGQFFIKSRRFFY